MRHLKAPIKILWHNIRSEAGLETIEYIGYSAVIFVFITVIASQVRGESSTLISGLRATIDAMIAGLANGW